MKRTPDVGGTTINDSGATAFVVESNEAPEKQRCTKVQGFSMLALGLLVLGGGLIGLVLGIQSDDDGTSESLTLCDIPFAAAAQTVTIATSIISDFHSAWNHLLGRSNTQDDSTVWDVMYSWAPRTPSPTPPGNTIMDIGMYQWNNHMTMHNTRFTSTVASQGRSQESKDSVRRELQVEEVPKDYKPPMPNLSTSRDADCQEALDLAKQKPSYRVADVKYRGWNAGGVDFSMYMLDNRMEMIDGVTFAMPGENMYQESIIVDSDAFTSVSVAVGSNTIGTQYNNLYMFDNSLSMTTTNFTMNVGQVPDADELQSGLFDIQTMNINMFMCHNTMTMDTTIFTMNVSPDMDPPSPGTVESQVGDGQNPGQNLATVLFLLVAGLEDQMGEVNIFEWMEDIAASGGSEVDINMHMYNNDMRMDGTFFEFNVGEEGLSRSTVELNQKKEQTRRKLINTDSTHDLKIKGESMAMVDTIFTMNVGSTAGGYTNTDRGMSIGVLNIKMYMFSNEMDMTDTIFTSAMSP